MLFHASSQNGITKLGYKMLNVVSFEMLFTSILQSLIKLKNTE